MEHNIEAIVDSIIFYPEFYVEYPAKPKEVCDKLTRLYFTNNMQGMPEEKHMDGIVIHVMRKLSSKYAKLVGQITTGYFTNRAGKVVSSNGSTYYEILIDAFDFEYKITIEELIKKANISSELILDRDMNDSKLFFYIWDFIAVDSGVEKYELANIDRLKDLVRQVYIKDNDMNLYEEVLDFSMEESTKILNYYYNNIMFSDEKLGNVRDSIEKHFQLK